jgi:restriction system protein
MIPDYQSLMRPLLEAAATGEVRISDAVDALADRLGLSDDERSQLLPSGKQTVISNRVHWAKTYLKQAGLLDNPRRAYFTITERGRQALADTTAIINNDYLGRFAEFQAFKQRARESQQGVAGGDLEAVPAARGSETSVTPDEALRAAHKRINEALAAELIERVRAASPSFFEQLVIELLLAMGYGGTSEDAGRALGRSGDGGVDGVIDQDPLGLDQVYVQAKRYAEGNTVGAGAIRDFYGSLSLKKATKGIFVTTSSFTPSAIETAAQFGSRIVLIEGAQLARLMIRYSVGARVEETVEIKRIDEEFFEA